MQSDETRAGEAEKMGETTPLEETLKEKIKRNGAITVHAYMATALSAPEHGYYMRQDPFGEEGDFITAPEITQMFGEMLGLWGALSWKTMGAPDPVQVVELGPGRGTLMSDAMRAAEVVPGFTDAAQIYMVEISPVLREIQRKTVLGNVGQVPAMRERIEDVASGPMILFANEFFDALPIRQFVKTEDGWCERMVGLDSAEDAFVFLAGAPLQDLSAIPEDLRDVPPGAFYEDCPRALEIVRDVAARLKAHGGVALFIDYGHGEFAVGETLQALKAHRYHDVLDGPGSADLTAHVNFAALAECARAEGVDVHGPVPQGAFLARLGMGERAEMLLHNANAAQAQEIRSAYHRLTDADEMGAMFKVLCLAAPGLPVAPWSQ